MTTINISLPETQAKMIDNFVVRFNFANRSEFFRALLRKVFTDIDALDETINYPFISPKTNSKKQVINAFVKSGRYSKEFLTDLKEGFENSSYFK